MKGSLNKKIILFCAVSLVAVCIMLIGRGNAPEESGGTDPAARKTEEPVSAVSATGAAVITSASEAAVSEERESPAPETEKGNGIDEAKEDKAADKTDSEDKKTAAGDSVRSPGAKETKGNTHSSEKEQKAQANKSVKAVSGKPLGEKQKKSEQERANDAASSVPATVPAAVPTAAPTAAPMEEADNECFLEINCAEALSHMDELNEGIKEMIPADGLIFQGKIAFQEGDTVFDALKKACREQNILLDYSFTPGFATYYIKGINHLYEFDCGDESGWLYSVNGKSPGYGCSQYKLLKGDQVVFYYACER